MRILITGISGFVAGYFLELLNREEPGSEVAGIYNETFPSFDLDKLNTLKISLYKTSLLDRVKFEEIIDQFRPEYILHLAGKSSVAESWKSPDITINDNTNFFLNIVETIRNLQHKCRILSVGSAEEYGNANEGKPLKETDCAKPVTPYGAARGLQQNLVAIYADSYHIDIIHTRSFNHIGPGQKPTFVISSFAKQLVRQKKEGKDILELKTGDVSVIRDFTDVRDVVKAYYILLYKGKTGETYNVCSGRGYMLKDIIQMMSHYINKKVHQSFNEANFRPSENKILIGSYAKINEQTGWTPQISIEKSLQDIISYWESSLII